MKIVIRVFFLEVSVQYPEKLHEARNGLPFLSKRIKIEKIEKLVVNLNNEREYVTHKKFKST